LRNQIKKLYVCFRKLRALPIWKQSQHGGAYFCEIEYDRETAEWHPHIHVTAQGVWIDNKALKAAWHEVTGDSFVVDVRRLKDNKETAHYVSKYMSKGTSSDVWFDHDVAQEWIVATKGLRVCGTFGSWRNIKLSGNHDDPGDWDYVGRLTEIWDRARSGSRVDQLLLLALKAKGAELFEASVPDAVAAPPPHTRLTSSPRITSITFDELRQKAAALWADPDPVLADCPV
jgi:hypothetical protein